MSGVESADSTRQLLFTVLVLLVTATLLLSVVSAVPLAAGSGLPQSAAGNSSEAGSGNGPNAGGSDDTSGQSSDSATFESFTTRFSSAEPEEPDDVEIEWVLSANATDVEKVRVEITNRDGKSINLFRPGGQDVTNPFTVSEDDGGPGKSADIVVDDLSKVSLTLKIPPGHCSRVDGVEATALGGSDRATAEPDIERSQSCTPTDTFAVAIEDYDETVTAGEPVNVTANVTNTGEATGSQDVRFLVNGTEIERTNLTLDADETRMVDFSYETTESDVGDLEIAVESDDDRATRTVTVIEPTSPEPAFFAVSIRDAPATVPAGDPVNVTANVTNTGEATGSQDVRFLVNGTEHERTNLTLDAGETRIVNFSYGTTESDVGDLELAIESENDTANRTVTVIESTVPASAFFAVAIQDAPTAVSAGESVNVTANVTNTGEVAGSQDVRFLVNGTEHERTNLTLDANETRTVQLSYGTTQSDVGDLEITVESENDTANRTVTVTEPASTTPAFFAVAIQDAPTAVSAGEPVNVTARVHNTGDRAGVQNVTLADVDGQVVDVNESLELAANESTILTLQWATTGSDVGEGDVTVSSANDTDTAAVEITEPAVESITVTLEDSVINATENTSITVEATYTDGSTRDVTENATLTANNSTVATVSPDGTVTGQSAGETAIEATFEGETASDQLTVEASGDADDGSDSSDDSGDGSDDSNDSGDSSDDSSDPGDGSDGSDDDSDDSTDDSSDGSDSDDSTGDSGSDDSPGGGSGSAPPAGGGSSGGGSSGGGSVSDPGDADDDGQSSDGEGSDPTDPDSTESDGGSESDDSEGDDSGGDDSEDDSTGDGSDESPEDDTGDEEDQRTTIVFFPVLGLLLLPMLLFATPDLLGTRL